MTIFQGDITSSPTLSSISVLPYGKRKVRYALLDKKPIFSANDIATICRVPLTAAFFTDWAAGNFHKTLLAGDDAVSVLGAETIASRAKYPGGRIVTGWVRRQSSLLMLDDDGKPQRPPVSILADGTIPPEPQAGTADWKAWADLLATITPEARKWLPPGWAVTEIN